MDLRERVAIVVDVCRAVQHAHDRGVIHRDLKPGNVLVSDGRPKVLDFGVARATNSDLATVSLRTDPGQLVGTLPYMSPEQVAGDSDELDSRTDVYSLGAVLYELLSGALPLDLSGESIPEAGRKIQDQDPAPLSRHDDALRGDLEVIVSKALEKDRDRRYPTPAALAADLERFLRFEPIKARPASAWYRMGKLVRRDPGLVIGILVAVVALLGLTGYAVHRWLYERQLRQEAQDARNDAETAQMASEEEMRLHEMISNFMFDVFGSLNSDTVVDQAMSMSQALDLAAHSAESAFADHPKAELRLRLQIGRTARNMAHFKLAESQLRRTLVLTRELYPDDEVMLALAKIDLSQLLSATGRWDEAQTTLLESIRVLRIGPVEPHQLGTALADLANMHNHRGELDTAAGFIDEAISLFREDAPTAYHLAVALNTRGSIHRRLREYDAAEAVFREALALCDRPEINLTAQRAKIANNLAILMQSRKRYPEARALFEDSLAARREVHGDDHPAVGKALHNLAVLLVTVEELSLAESNFRAAATLFRQAEGDQSTSVARILCSLADCLIRNKKPHDAKQELEEALRLLGPKGAGNSVGKKARRLTERADELISAMKDPR